MATRIHFIGSEPPLLVNDDFATVQAALTSEQSVAVTRTDGSRTAQVFRDSVAFIEDLGALPKPDATIEPAAGPRAGGTVVTISSNNMFNESTNDVTFGGTSAVSMNVDSFSQITAVTPAGSGTVDVLVVTPVPSGGPGLPAGQFTYY